MLAPAPSEEVAKPILLSETPAPEDNALAELPLAEGTQSTVPAETDCEHKAMKTETTAASCTKEGRIRCVCADCGQVLEDKTLQKTGHSWVHESDETGHWKQCSRCNEQGSQEAHTMKNGVCEICGYGCAHSFTETVTEATCRNGGSTKHTCLLCGYAYTDQETPALEHHYVYTIEKEPDCENVGSGIFACESCGDTFRVTLFALGHKADENGVCIRCGKRLTEATPSPTPEDKEILLPDMPLQ